MWVGQRGQGERTMGFIGKKHLWEWALDSKPHGEGS